MNSEDRAKKKLDDLFANSLRENNVSLGENVRIYKFNRGEKYSCLVKVINDGEHVMFDDIEVPIGTSEEVMAKMLDEAEAMAVKATDDELEKKWAST